MFWVFDVCLNEGLMELKRKKKGRTQQDLDSQRRAMESREKIQSVIGWIGWVEGGEIHLCLLEVYAVF